MSKEAIDKLSIEVDVKANSSEEKAVLDNTGTTIICFKNGEKVEVPGFYKSNDDGYPQLNEINYEYEGKKRRLIFCLSEVLYMELRE